MKSKMFVIEEYTDILDPSSEMLGPVPDESILVVRTAPGCWGPMLTPELKSGHEVTQPLAVEGAEPGDALMVKIRDIRILSVAGCSGTGKAIAKCFVSDPNINAKCPSCGRMNPSTIIDGFGKDAIKCKECGAVATPFIMTNGYTMILGKKFGITAPPNISQDIALRPSAWAAIPKGARQHAATILGSADLIGLVSRIRPMIGNIGCCPAVKFPASRNSTDLALFLKGKLEEFPVDDKLIFGLTDGHLDSDQVRSGAILVSPIKVKGAGFYLGDVHAMQGDGEIAGHTVDVSAEVIMNIKLIKGLKLEGPILFPHPDDLHYLAQPLTKAEWEEVEDVASRLNVPLERTLPIQIIGSGLGLNDAIENGLKRASNLFQMSIDEVKNRATIAGSVEIARSTGIVQITLLVPVDILDKLGLLQIAKDHYQV